MKLKFIVDKKYDRSFIHDKALLRDFDKKYKDSLKYLKLTKVLYQKSWNEINDELSAYVERATGYSWFYPVYECVVSAFHHGISNWGVAPKVVRGWKENPYSMRRITAHEIIISHYFVIYNRHYKKTGLSKGQIWALAEIAAFALTSFDPLVKRFWPWDTNYYTNHNYPHIVKLQNKLKETFIKRKNFDEYIQKGINLVKKYPHISPTEISSVAKHRR